MGLSSSALSNPRARVAVAAGLEEEEEAEEDDDDDDEEEEEEEEEEDDDEVDPPAPEDSLQLGVNMVGAKVAVRTRETNRGRGWVGRSRRPKTVDLG